MEIFNELPLFLECMTRWENAPSRSTYESELVNRSFDEVYDGFYEAVSELDWPKYRAHVLKLDPVREEARVRGAIRAVEDLFGFQLAGELVILSAFESMDGYARFDRGTHRVYFGVDESFDAGKYLDILIAHELTHVARESRPQVWEGFGLDPRMTQRQFTQSQPVIEHVMGEGFSCAVSEILVPGEAPWLYAYQSEESWQELKKRSASIEQAVRSEIARPYGDYGKLYGLRPLFCHYAWGWQWVKSVMSGMGAPREAARTLVSRCSKEFIPDALSFQSKP